MDHATPVVVLGSGHHGGLGIVRSLGRLAVPVHYVHPSWWEPAFSSRYCRGRRLLNLENGPPEEGVARLLKIGRKLGGRPILIPTTDTWTIWVADHAAALEETYRFPRQDAALVRTLCDKSRMHELARQSGVPTAQSVVPQSKADVERFVETAVFPVMAKATDAGSFRRATGGTKFVIQTPGELLALYAKAEDPEGPNFLIQEFIPGDDWMFDGYFDRNSDCVFGITGRKIRRFPVNTGVTSLGVCLRNQIVEGTTAHFMKSIGYRGILDIGYRYDRRDGQYKVLDVNPRIGCTFRLFTSSSGMDVARTLYLDMTGQPILAAQAVEGRKWMVEDFDLFSAFRSLRDGSLSVKEWARSFRGVREAACFASDDPLPFLTMGVADCFEFYRWIRCRTASRKPAPTQKALFNPADGCEPSQLSSNPSSDR